jgi:hypothetical protein
LRNRASLTTLFLRRAEYCNFISIQNARKSVSARTYDRDDIPKNINLRVTDLSVENLYCDSLIAMVISIDIPTAFS